MISFNLIKFVFSYNAVLYFLLKVTLTLSLQGVYINQTIIINNTKFVISTLSEKIIDNPRLSFYQTVYAVGLILLLIMAYLTAHSYMAVSQL